MPGKLEGRIAIVTGADSGIGQAIAIEFAREGADIAISYLHDRAGAAETRRQIEAAGRRAIAVQADQRQEPGVAHLFQRTQEQLGPPYILVNNAGIGFSHQPVADMSVQEWDDRLRTDLYGPFFCCQHFIRARRQAGGRGKIINITSVHEEMPHIGAAAYCAAKGGLRNLTRTLSLELAPDRINVNNIAPGAILTPMNQAALDDPALRARSAQRIPWERQGEPWEIARLALYLASEDADYTTGQSFTLDGGLMWGRGG